MLFVVHGYELFSMEYRIRALINISFVTMYNNKRAYLMIQNLPSEAKSLSNISFCFLSDITRQSSYAVPFVCEE